MTQPYSAKCYVCGKQTYDYVLSARRPIVCKDCFQYVPNGFGTKANIELMEKKCVECGVMFKTVTTVKRCDKCRIKFGNRKSKRKELK